MWTTFSYPLPDVKNVVVRFSIYIRAQKKIKRRKRLDAVIVLEGTNDCLANCGPSISRLIMLTNLKVKVCFLMLHI